MKGGVRIAAMTTGPIGKGSSRKSGKRVLLVCVVGTLNGIEGILSTNVTVDGKDATQKIAGMIKRSRFRDQVKVLVFNGIAIAGLNVLDVSELDSALSTRTIVITRHKPHRSLLVKSLRALRRDTGADIKERIKLLAAQKKSVVMDGFYVQSYLNRADTKHVIKTAAELLRLSHLIASGVSKGESKGRV